MRPAVQRRLSLGTVWLLAGIVSVLGVLQVLGVMDRLNLVVGSFAVFIAVVALPTSLEWLPSRNRR